MKKSQKILLFTVGMILLFSIVSSSYIYYLLFTPPDSESSNKALEFTIEKGERLDSISKRLHQNGLLKDPAALKLASFFRGGSQKIKAGVHRLHFQMTAWEIYATLKLSPQKEFQVLTIPEGWDSFEIAELLSSLDMAEAADFLEIVKTTGPDSPLLPQVNSMEGYLFPDSYYIPLDANATDIIEMMRKRFFEIFDDRLLSQFQANSLSLKEGVTLASLIAKEAGNVEEMPLISSVFHNRLRLGMKLDCDPTFIYASKIAGAWDNKIDVSDKQRDSKYNTYFYKGLPPGAIGNPGINALEAAANPAQTKFLYFVAKGPDRQLGHFFSETFREHQQAVNRYRTAIRASR